MRLTEPFTKASVACLLLAGPMLWRADLAFRSGVSQTQTNMPFFYPAMDRLVQPSEGLAFVPASSHFVSEPLLMLILCRAATVLCLSSFLLAIAASFRGEGRRFPSATAAIAFVLMTLCLRLWSISTGVREAI
jgi:hypothetical protein